jgi:hypothetical protein
VVRDLTVGIEHTLRVEREGYTTREVRFTLSSLTLREIHIELGEAGELGALTISSQPEGAVVTINGMSAGETPLNNLPLRSGRELRVELSLNGYETYSTTVQLDPYESEILDRRMVRRSRSDRGSGSGTHNGDSDEEEEEEVDDERYQLLR